MIVLLRRRKLGRTSCREMAKLIDRFKSVRNDLWRKRMPKGTTHVIRWGCTSSLAACGLDDRDIIVFNRASAIQGVNDKYEFRKKLNESGLCPRTWFLEDDYAEAIPDDVFGKGVVLRSANHSRGRNLFVSHSPADLAQKMERLFHKTGDDRMYVSELIDKVAEYRVFCVQGRVACVAEKTPGNPDEVAWNVAKGGRFDNVRWDNWPLRAVRIALEAFNISKLDFGGVDIMVDGDGKCYVLEINSAPSLTSPYRQECMAKCLNSLCESGHNKIPLIKEKGGYKKFIHPAICDRAEVGE